MKTITSEDWQLLSFFEVEPEFASPSAPQPYTDGLYKVERGVCIFSCAIAPAYRDVRIILFMNGSQVFEFGSMGVEDVQYAKDDGVEMLRIIIDDRSLMPLKVKPNIKIVQSVQMEQQTGAGSGRLHLKSLS